MIQMNLFNHILCKMFQAHYYVGQKIFYFKKEAYYMTVGLQIFLK